MEFGVVVFPGTWSDGDCYDAVTTNLGQQARYVWHKDSDLSGIDCVIVPGGFSYGDYLRAGAIAKFSPVMRSIERFAEDGGLVIGICNGFQILCEAGLLPGALMRNDHLQFRCQWVNLRVETTDTPFTNRCDVGDILAVPISHGEGNYYADVETLERIESNGQVVFRYSDGQGSVTTESNPNGSVRNIAGITNRRGNVLGMMPHPERCCDDLMGGTDGLAIFESILRAAEPTASLIGKDSSQ